MKYVAIILFGLIASVLFLQSRIKSTSLEKPIFLDVDGISSSQSTSIVTTIHSFYKPNAGQLVAFKRDYAAIWAHLNYLYSTGDVAKGKEYYTQDWFKMICNEYKQPLSTNITRYDASHNLHIINWSFDGLVCNIIDSNVVIKTYYKNNLIDSVKSSYAIALLFQGDHWRIEGLKQLD